MKLATLTGYAIPAQAIPMADHTYVNSSDGRSWGCWGRQAGGAPLTGASNIGDADLADCISQVNSTAGIVYGITGVCHQMANRILDPSNVFVQAARGYGQSVMLFGTYGLNLRVAAAIPWPQKKINCGSPPPAPVPAPHGTKSSNKSSFSKAANKPNDALRELYADATVIKEPHAWKTHVRRQIAGEALLKGLSFKTPLKDFSSISMAIATHLELFEERMPLVYAVLSGEIGGADYARAVNDLNVAKLEYVARHVKPEFYRNLYGSEPGERIDVVDPETAHVALEDLTTGGVAQAAAEAEIHRATS